MINFFKSLFSNNGVEDDISSSTHASYQIDLIREAESTMDLAKEISNVLKSDINNTDKKLTSVCNMLQDQLIIVDVEGTIQFINDRAKFYFPKLSIINKNLFDVMTLDFDNIKDLYISTKNKNKLHYYDVEIDGVKYKMDISISYIEFETAKNVYVLLIDNITERIDFENEIIESNEKFKIFSELTNDAMIIVQNNKIVANNNKFTFISEYSDINYQLFGNLFDDIPLSGRLFRYETILNTKNNRKINVSVNRENIIWNDIESQIYVIRDISIFKQTEKNLELRAERFSDLLNHSYIALCCFDSMLKITYANDVFLKDFDLTKYEVLNKSILDILPEKDKITFMENVLKISPTNTGYRSLHVCNDRYKDFVCFGKYSNNILDEYQCSIRDITNYYK